MNTGEEIISLISDLSRRLGVTVISATHDHKMLATSDRILWIKAAQNDTVLVTPGISPCERDMKNIAINCRLPLIHLQKEPITKKPEGERFFACAEGSLLILAPWPDDLDAMPSQLDGAMNHGPSTPLHLSSPLLTPLNPSVPSNYDRFHNMNLLAKQICEMDTINLPLSFRVIG